MPDPCLDLYVITDRRWEGGRDPVEVAQAAIRGGATAIQLRYKELPVRELLRVGRRLREVTREHGVLFIVNDRADLALALEADGVHLGQDDLPLPAARRVVGPRLLIGVSVADEGEALRAQREGADYLGVGPIFATATKDDAGAPVGLERLRQLRRVSHLPLVAIGGIGPKNAAQVVQAGADGVAVVSAVVGQPDVAAAAAMLARQVRHGKDMRCYLAKAKGVAER